MGEILIGLDIGTGSVKAVAADRTGKMLGEVSSALTTSAPAPGAAEQDPRHLLAAVVEVIAEATSCAAQLAPQPRVVAIAAAAQSGSLVPIAPGGEPARAITWMDTRSAHVINQWSASERAMIRHHSGWGVSAGLGLSTIAWLRECEPVAFATTERFASVDDFVVHQLTGEWSTNPSNAAGMQLMNVATSEWSRELCRLAGVAREQLSTIAATGSMIGQLKSGAAVVAGGHDQACAALALGVVEPGTAFLSAGTAWVLTSPVAGCSVDALPEGINLSPHFVAGRWSASRHIGGVGAAIASTLQEVGVAVEDVAALLHTHSPLTTEPFFVPNFDDPARVAWGRFRVTSDESTTASLAWAVLESAAFEVKRALDSLAALFTDSTTLVVVGKAATPLICRLIATACNITIIRRDEMSWPAFGAAQIAAAHLGWQIPSPTTSGDATVHPDPALADALGARYCEYQDHIEGD